MSQEVILVIGNTSIRYKYNVRVNLTLRLDMSESLPFRMPQNTLYENKP
jgi:hypothetical protein